MIVKYAIPIVAVVLIVVAAAYVVSTEREPPTHGPRIPPPRTPFADTVAGAGIIEAKTENISIGSPLAGIVVEVMANQGEKVKQGEPLFRLDDRALRADLQVRQAALAAAKAEVEKLKHQPRPEEIPVSEAQVAEFRSTLRQKKDQFERVQKLARRQAATAEDVETSEREYGVAKAELDRSDSELALLNAGAWQYDVGIAEAAVARAAAEIAQTKTELDRLIVRASVDGEVLQVNVRPGEFITTFGQQSAIVLGNTHELHVRVDIDEYDVPRFDAEAPAVARRRGHAGDHFPLTFVRVDPYVIPKRSLTGENTERVDTRVLQVIYEIDSQGERLYVGQQLDVFVDESGTAVHKSSSHDKNSRRSVPAEFQHGTTTGNPVAETFDDVEWSR